VIFRRRKSRDETRNGTRHVAIVVENVALGVDTRLRKQVHDLLANGHRVSVVTMRSADNVGYRTTSNLRVLEYPPPPEVTGSIGYVVEYLVSLAWAVALLSRLRLRGRIDVLQVCQPPDVYFPLCWLLRWSGTRVVIDQRDLMPELFAARYDDPSRAMLGILRWLERRTQRVADHTLCVNEYLRDRLVDAGAEPATISIVRNGPVLARVEKVSADPTLKESQRFLICWIGKMGKQDRVDLVVQLAEHVLRDLGRSDCRFAILGDGECLDDLRASVTARGLEEWVRLPGWLPEERVFTYLATADVGVDTSLQVEVSPVKAMEYMAFSLPLLCFDLPETRRIAVDAAVLVRPPDVLALGEALIALLDDPATRSQLGAEGRHRVFEELGWERQTPTYLSAITSTHRR